MARRELDMLVGLSAQCFAATGAARNLPGTLRRGRYDTLRVKLEALQRAATLGLAALDQLCADPSPSIPPPQADHPGA